MRSATQSTPAGCFLMIFAMIPGILCGTGLWGLVKWLQLPVAQRHFDHTFWFIFGCAIGGGILAAAIFWIGRKVLRATNFRGYDPNDPGKTKLHW